MSLMSVSRPPSRDTHSCVEREPESPPTQQAPRITGRLHPLVTHIHATVEIVLELIYTHKPALIHTPPLHVCAVLWGHIRAAEETRTSRHPRV